MDNCLPKALCLNYSLFLKNINLKLMAVFKEFQLPKYLVTYTMSESLPSCFAFVYSVSKNNILNVFLCQKRAGFVLSVRRKQGESLCCGFQKWTAKQSISPLLIRCCVTKLFHCLLHSKPPFYCWFALTSYSLILEKPSACLCASVVSAVHKFFLRTK